MDPAPHAHDYFRLRVEIGQAHRAWLAEQLTQLGFPAFEEQRHAGRARFVVYDQSRERLLATERELRSRAAELEGVALGGAIDLAPQDWMLRWTEYLEPVQLTPSLLLVPSAQGSPGTAGVLYLEPAFAFGFGEHASTRLLARWVEARCRAQPGCSLLDVGCGTGVLALVAKKSGAGRVVGVDISEPAVLAARANAARNGLEACFEQRSAAGLGERFEVVVANIEAPVLLSESAELVRCLGPGSQLALAGFIEEQASGLVRHFGARGVELEPAASEADWCLLAGRASVTGRP